MSGPNAVVSGANGAATSGATVEPLARPGRLAGLRVLLVLAASVEIALLLAAVPHVSPGRAAIVAGVLAIEATLALLTVYALGTSRRIAEGAATAIALVIVGGLVVAPIGLGVPDPTQTGPADLELSATCSASPDARIVTATVDFRWLRTDFFPDGIAGPARGNAMHDAIALFAEDASMGYSSLLAPPMEATAVPSYVATPSPDLRAPEPPLGYVEMPGPLPWTATSGPTHRTVDGRPQDFGWNAPAPDGSMHDPFGGGGEPGAMALRPSSVGAGSSYAATWTFTKVDGWFTEVHEPVLLATYWHGDRFVSQVLVACTGPARPPVRFDQRLSG